MRIHLVNPVYPASLWDFAGCRDITGKKYAHPPLSLPTVAALTPREHEVRITDENVGPVDLNWKADIVGITGYHIQRERVFELADAFRARGALVAIGGPMVEESSLAECAEHADVVFKGEAEYTWPRFLAEHAAGRAEKVYVQQEFVSMPDSPAPRFDLLDLASYSTTTIETSRGCPYTCEFCEIPGRLGQRSRHKTVEQVMAEVRSLRALGADSIFFVDDHFIGDRAFTVRLLKELAAFVREQDYGIYFTCQFTINLARDKELLALLHAAHFRRVFVGIETPRKESLISAHKRQNAAGDMLESIEALQAHGITVWAGIIVGFDGDDAGIFAEQREFLQRSGIPVAMIGLLQAIPGTPLYARMEREERLRAIPVSGVRGTAESLLVSNILHPVLSDRELGGGFQSLVKSFYDYEPFGERLILSLSRRSKAPLPLNTKLGLEQLRMLARIGAHYLLTTDGARRRLFTRVMAAVLRRGLDAEMALMHLVVYKHLRGFYHHLSSLPVPELPAAAKHELRRDLAMKMISLMLALSPLFLAACAAQQGGGKASFSGGMMARPQAQESQGNCLAGQIERDGQCMSIK